MVVLGGRVVGVAVVVGATVVDGAPVVGGEVEGATVDAGTEVGATVGVVTATLDGTTAVEGLAVGGIALVWGAAASVTGAADGDGVDVVRGTRELKSSVGGTRSRSTAWSTPFSTFTSGPVTLASLRRTTPLTDCTLTGEPSAVA